MISSQRKQTVALVVTTTIFIWLAATANSLAAVKDPWPGVKRIVFLGDSITYSGAYVEFVEAWFVTRFPDRSVEFINLGLPSETVSGLSEPGHAGGQFPRPYLHERLDRVLQKTRPGLVVACYGMNCGVYYPFSEDRFAKYRAGILRIRERCVAEGARVLHVTPPTFDPEPIRARTLPAGAAVYDRPYVGYNEVLDRYSEWLLSQRKTGWDVVDVHDPMNRFIATRRETDPQFRLASDGVHANKTGHWLIASQIIRHLGDEEAAKAETPEQMVAGHPRGREILKLVGGKQRMLKDAWLTETRHLRPGMTPGVPLPEAEAKASEVDRQIHKLAKMK